MNYPPGYGAPPGCAPPFLPGAPGAPAPQGTPVWDTLGPLGRVFSPNSRGNTGIIGPPGGVFDAEGIISGPAAVTIFSTMTGIECVRGEELCVVLGRQLHTTTANPTPESFLTDQAVLAQVRAVITFGQGSANYTVECDWLHGTCLAITCEQITVQARYVLQVDPGGSLPQGYMPPTFDLAASVGYKASERNSNGARLTEVRFVPAQGTKRIRIPERAISMNVFPFGSSATIEAHVRAFGAPYTQVYTSTSPLTGYQVENALPLFEGAEFVELVNGDAEEDVRAAVIFGLAA